MTKLIVIMFGKFTIQREGYEFSIIATDISFT